MKVTCCVFEMTSSRKWHHFTTELNSLQKEMAEKCPSAGPAGAEDMAVWLEKIDRTNPIGFGAFCVVYKVTETVAVKVVTLKDHSPEDIEDAGKCLNLPGNHPNILKIYGFSEDAEHKYIYMEFCNLGNLRTFCTKQVLRDKVCNKE